jgi:hypothetical protein
MNTDKSGPDVRLRRVGIRMATPRPYFLMPIAGEWAREKADFRIAPALRANRKLSGRQFRTDPP